MIKLRDLLFESEIDSIVKILKKLPDSFFVSEKSSIELFNKLKNINLDELSKFGFKVEWLDNRFKITKIK